MPVLLATVSSLPSPNIFRYQLVSISLMSAALFLSCDPCFPDEELRLASWELLRWALVPLREATDCLRCTWCCWCPTPGPPTPPPLLRAANMVPEGAHLHSRAEFRERSEEREPQVSQVLQLLSSRMIRVVSGVIHIYSKLARLNPEYPPFWASSFVLQLTTFATSAIFCNQFEDFFSTSWQSVYLLCVSFYVCVCAVCSLFSYSLIQPETGSWFPCLVTAYPSLKGGSHTCQGVDNVLTVMHNCTHTGNHNRGL